jgi:hypothetical protein
MSRFRIPALSQSNIMLKQELQINYYCQAKTMNNFQLKFHVVTFTLFPFPSPLFEVVPLNRPVVAFWPALKIRSGIRFTHHIVSRGAH